MDTAEYPHQALFSPQRTEAPATSAPPSPVGIFYNGFRVADMLAAESVSNIRSFMHSSSRIATARNLRGREAQRLIDLIDRVCCTPSRAVSVMMIFGKLIMGAGPHIARTGRRPPKTMLTPTLQTLQSLRITAGHICSARRAHMRQYRPPLRRVCRCQPGGIPRTPRGHQTTQTLGEGRVRQNFQGTRAITHPR